MKDNIDYYPHDADSHNSAKFFTLRIKYGWAGEGMFWALNNMIASASGCHLDVSSIMRKAPIASLFGMDFEALEQFFIYLSRDCELIQYKDGKIATERVTDTYEKIKVSREKARSRKSPKKPSSGGKGQSSGELSKSSGEPNKRVNKSKVNKSKQEEREEREDAPAPDGQKFDQADLDDFAASEAEAKEKSSAKKESGADGPVTEETAARVVDMKRRMRGEPAPAPDNPDPEPAPFDLIADTVDWLNNHPAGRETWAAIRRYLDCAPTELTDPTKTVEAAAVFLGPGKTSNPQLFRRSLGGCATTQLKKDREELTRSTHHPRSRKPDQPVITREQSIRVAKKILAKRAAARAATE